MICCASFSCPVKVSIINPAPSLKPFVNVAVSSMLCVCAYKSRSCSSCCHSASEWLDFHVWTCTEMWRLISRYLGLLEMPASSGDRVPLYSCSIKGFNFNLIASFLGEMNKIIPIGLMIEVFVIIWGIYTVLA